MIEFRNSRGASPLGEAPGPRKRGAGNSSRMIMMRARTSLINHTAFLFMMVSNYYA